METYYYPRADSCRHYSPDVKHCRFATAADPGATCLVVAEYQRAIARIRNTPFKPHTRPRIHVPTRSEGLKRMEKRGVKPGVPWHRPRSLTSVYAQRYGRTDYSQIVGTLYGPEEQITIRHDVDPPQWVQERDARWLAELDEYNRRHAA